jgi:hypothetical protein
MQLFRRFLYLFYYLKESDFNQLNRFLHFSASSSGKSRFSILIDALHSSVKYGVSFKDYFCFRFFEIGDEDRSKWAGTGFMYEYQLLMNPRQYRKVLEDKILFLTYFKKYVKRKYCTINQFISDQDYADALLKNSTGMLVLKGSHGQVGAEVEVVKSIDFNHQSLIEFMIRNSYDLVEEYVIQHRVLMELSPSGLNTVRVITQVHSGVVDIIGARLRITINSTVDNMAAGNIAASVDLDNGVLNGPGIFSDITKNDLSVHPVTGIKIEGFKIPFWKEVIEMAKNAALQTPENKSVGWDIAITDEGPELIEGNHNWCKLLWQLPVKKGMKAELVKYM